MIPGILVWMSCLTILRGDQRHTIKSSECEALYADIDIGAWPQYQIAEVECQYVVSAAMLISNAICIAAQTLPWRLKNWITVDLNGTARTGMEMLVS